MVFLGWVGTVLKERPQGSTSVVDRLAERLEEKRSFVVIQRETLFDVVCEAFVIAVEDLLDVAVLLVGGRDL